MKHQLLTRSLKEPASSLQKSPQQVIQIQHQWTIKVLKKNTLLPLSTIENGLEETILHTKSLNKSENILVGMGTTEDVSLTNVSAIKHDMQYNLMFEITYEEINNEDQFAVKARLDDIDEYISSSGNFSSLVRKSPFTEQNESDLPKPLISGIRHQQVVEMMT